MEKAPGYIYLKIGKRNVSKLTSNLDIGSILITGYL